MAFNIGDPVFSNLGEPGIVVEATEGEQLKVDRNFKSVQDKFRNGYIKGLNEDARLRFNKIMDEVGAIEEPAAKAELLQKRIHEFESYLSPKAQVMAGYLKAELAHVLNSYGYQPRYYDVPAGRVP